MKIATVYLAGNQMPSSAEVEEFDRKGGLVRLVIEQNWPLYLGDLIDT